MPSCRSRTAHPQDGGWAWLVCFCAMFCVTLHMGISNCFAVPLPVLLDTFKETKERLGWLGSLSSSMTFILTPLAGMFIQRFGCRMTSLVGSVTCAVGLVVTSFAKSLLVMYFSYGLLFGIGSCFIHTGSVFVVTMYFNRRRSLATAIMGTSQSIGILILGPLMQTIMDALGWRNMYRVLAATFGLALIVALTFDPNVEDPHSVRSEQNNPEEGQNGQEVQENQKGRERENEKQKFTLAFFKVPAFIISLSCLTIGTFGTLVTFVHLIKYCEEIGISAQRASRLFTIIGGTALVCSVVSGRLMDFKKVSPFHVNQLANITLAVSLLVLPQCFKYLHFIIFSVFFGAGFGAFVPTIYLLLLNNVEPRHRIYAFPFGETIISVGTLGGAPFAGFIADTTGSYVPAFYTFGSLLVLASLLVFPVYCFKLDKTNQLHNKTRELVYENQGCQLEEGHQKYNAQSMELEVISNEEIVTSWSEKQLESHVVESYHYDNLENAEVGNHVGQIHHGNGENADLVDEEEKEANCEGVANEGLNTEDIETKF